MATSNKDLISKTLAQRMMTCIEEYEAIKTKTSTRFKTVKEFCEFHKFSHQNFMKIYHRYKQNPVSESLLPQKRGPRFNTRKTDPEIEKRIIELRQEANDRYMIARMVAKQGRVSISPSTVYNICKKHGLNRLNEKQRAERRRIITEKAGELAHTDLHYLSPGIIKSNPTESYYVLGVIDDCTRTVWLELLKNKKAFSVVLATQHALGSLDLEYGIQFNAIMTDNGSEFTNGKRTVDGHPYEMLLESMNIEHRYIPPYHPQTNGKIERFWRTLDEELLKGSSYDSFDDLKLELQGYSVYFNEYRPHSSLNGVTPSEALENVTN